MANRTGFTVAAGRHQDVVKAQREFMALLADRIENGEPFERAGERKLVAGILRAWARQLPDAPDGAASIDPGYAAIHFAVLVNGEGRDRDAAARELSALYGAAPEAIAEAIAPFEASAMRLVPRRK